MSSFPQMQCYSGERTEYGSFAQFHFPESDPQANECVLTVRDGTAPLVTLHLQKINGVASDIIKGVSVICESADLTDLRGWNLSSEIYNKVLTCTNLSPTALRLYVSVGERSEYVFSTQVYQIAIPRDPNKHPVVLQSKP